MIKQQRSTASRVIMSERVTVEHWYKTMVDYSDRYGRTDRRTGMPVDICIDGVAMPCHERRHSYDGALVPIWHGDAAVTGIRQRIASHRMAAVSPGVCIAANSSSSHRKPDRCCKLLLHAQGSNSALTNPPCPIAVSSVSESLRACRRAGSGCSLGPPASCRMCRFRTRAAGLHSVCIEDSCRFGPVLSSYTFKGSWLVHG